MFRIAVACATILIVFAGGTTRAADYMSLLCTPAVEPPTLEATL